MKTHKCQFILASDLFKGLENLWAAFADSSPPFSWGDNNRTLVTAEAILNHCDNTDSLAGLRSVATLRLRIANLPQKGQTYVDLEN